MIQKARILTFIGQVYFLMSLSGTGSAETVAPPITNTPVANVKKQVRTPAQTAEKIDSSIQASLNETYVTFDKFFDLAGKIFLDSYNSDVLKQKFNSTKSLVASTKEYTPWRFDSRTDYYAFDDAKLINGTNSTLSSLGYNTPSGFGAKLSVKTGSGADDFNDAARVAPLVGRVYVGQEILKSGSNSPEIIAREMRALTGKHDYFKVEDQVFEEKLRFVALVTQYYGLLCKIGNIQKFNDKFKTVFRSGEIQKSTKLTSSKNYLYLKNTENMFNRKMRSYDGQKVRLSAQLNRFSPSLYTFASELKVEQAQCPNLKVEEMSLPALDEKKMLDTANLVPSNVVLGLQKAQKELSVKLERANQMPSFVPFAGVRYTQRDDKFLEKSGWDGQIGFTFRYEFQSEENRLKEKAVLAESVYLTSLMRKVRDDAIGNMRQLYANVQEQINILPEIQSSIQTSEKLIKVIETERDVGLSDSTVVANTYLAHIDNLSALVDVWSEYQVNKYQLNIFIYSAKKMNELKGQIN